MDGLKPCPFCGGEADLIDMSDEYEGEYWVAHQCPSGASIETFSYETSAEAIAAWNTPWNTPWNTRSERTCRNTDDDCDAWFKCSECGLHSKLEIMSGGYGIPNYCPSCGAKVVS